MFTLSLPAPLSVNATRRIDWRNYPKVKAWLAEADGIFLQQKRALMPLAIKGPFEVTIVLRDGSRIDADNAIKAVIDVLRRFRLVADDRPELMRRVVVEFGDVEGCQVTVNPVSI